MRRLAVAGFLLCAALAAGTLVLLGLGTGERTVVDGTTFDGWDGLSFVAASLTFGTVGAMVAARVPGNAIGWVFCLTGVMLGAGGFGSQYADHMLFIAAEPLPGGATAAWLHALGFAPSFGLLGIVLLLFPDGRLPSRRWRPLLWLALAGITASVAGVLLAPGALVEPFESVSNPLDLGLPRELTDQVVAFGFLSTVLCVALAALGLPVRLRRSRGRERQQLKWLALGAAAAGAAVLADLLLYLVWEFQTGPGTLGIGFAIFPLVAGAAILRYRLYDIDVVINRAVVYGALTVALGAAYLAIVLLLQVALGGLTEGSGLAVAGSTLAVAALFRPARARIQATVDRRFYRSRYDAARTLERFGAQLRDEVDLDALAGALREVVGETMQPSTVSLWLRRGDEGR